MDFLISLPGHNWEVCKEATESFWIFNWVEKTLMPVSNSTQHVLGLKRRNSPWEKDKVSEKDKISEKDTVFVIM